MERIKVLVVDDHYLVRRGLREVLSQNKGLEIAGEASNGAEAVSKAKELQPQVIVMDLQMPIMGGLEATRLLQSEAPQAYILILTVSDKEADLMAAMAAGARGYLLKDADSEEILRAILHIAEGGGPGLLYHGSQRCPSLSRLLPTPHRRREKEDTYHRGRRPQAPLGHLRRPQDGNTLQPSTGGASPSRPRQALTSL